MQSIVIESRARTEEVSWGRGIEKTFRKRSWKKVDLESIEYNHILFPHEEMLSRSDLRDMIELK